MKQRCSLLIALLFMGVTVVAQTTDEAPIITPVNAAGLAPVQVLDAHTMPVNNVAFRPPDGDVLASTGEDLALRLWDVTGDSAPQLAEAYPHNAVMKGLDFTPDGEIILTGSWDRTVRRHRILEGYTLDALPAFIGFNHIVDGVRYSPDGAWLGLTVGDGSVHLLNAADFDERQIFPLNALTVPDFAFFPAAEDGAFVVATGFPDDAVLLGAFGTTELQALDHNHTGGVLALAVYPAQDAPGVWMVVTAGDDSTFRVWQATLEAGGDWAFSALSVTTPADNLWFTAMAFSPSGEILTLATREGAVYVYDMSQPSAPALLTMLSVSAGRSVNALAFNPAGTLLATGDDSGQIILWGVSIGDN